MGESIGMTYPSIFQSIINEAGPDRSGTKWVHYSNHEFLSVHPKAFHSDAAGIYFFPDHVKPDASMWHQKTYKYVVTLKPETRVLVLPDIPDAMLDRLVANMEVTKFFDDYITRYPPENRIKKIKMAWEMIRTNSPSGWGTGKGSRWNKVLRDLGYDAVFDDSAIIHFAEPIQLLVLNPRVINVVARITQKVSYFQIITKIIDELKAVCEPFGEVVVVPPRLQKSSWSYSKILQGAVEVSRSKDIYARFSVGHDPKETPHLVRVGLQYSQPRLGYGVGASFDARKGEWEFGGLESLTRDLARIFVDDPKDAS
jgi:hypothetical protein